MVSCYINEREVVDPVVIEVREVVHFGDSKLSLLLLSRLSLLPLLPLLLLP